MANKKKKSTKEYESETKEFKKIDLQEKDEIETIEETIKKEKRKKKKRTMKKLKVLLLLLLIAIGCLLYARFISTRGLLIKEHSITSNELAIEYDGLKIIHITDIHYGSSTFKEELDHIVKVTNKQKPDIIIFTGDLIETGVKLTNTEINNIIKIFNKFDASLGMYAVKGNHDYENSYFDTIIEKSKFKLLLNEDDYIYKDTTTPIRIIGLDDLLKGKPEYDNTFLLPEEMETPYTIVLIHEPDQIEEFKEEHTNYNIVFAGHSHQGQVRLPGIGALWTPIGSKKYYDEHYKVNDKDLYISGGVGTTMLPIRFFNKPSITLYRFYAQ